MPVIVVFSGEYDLSCKKQLRRELERLYSEPDVILDFSQVTYLDSTCFTELLLLHRFRMEKGYDTESIVIASPQLHKLFAILSLHKIFRVADSIDTAGGKNGKKTVVRYAFEGGADQLAPAAHDPPLRFAK